MLQVINKDLLKQTEYNQWKDSADVINWFINIENKNNCRFIKFDIKDCYTLISEDILKDAIPFANQYHQISIENARIIHHCRKSLLFSKN